MACFAMAVTAASTVEGFVPPSPCLVVTAQHTTPATNLFYNKRSNTQQRTSSTSRSYASSVATLGDATSILPDTSSYRPEHQHEPTPWKRPLLPKKVRIRRKQQQQTAQDYEQRKQEWAATYTSVDALRETFGGNQNTMWGDLDATTARRLYKTLLPRALMELYRLGVHPEDLAPLAYQARVAAKNYARERSIVPTRLLAMTYDGIRQWKRYGKFQVKGMTYDQVWNKYKQLIHEEEEGDLDERDVTAKICLKILERSCETNAHVDRLFLRDFHHDPAKLQEEDRDIDTLTGQLERDVRAILDEATSKKSPATMKKQHKALSAQQVRTLRMVARAKQRMERLGSHFEDHHQDEEEEESALPPRQWKARVSKTHDRPKPWQHRTHPKRTH
jgi:hypothetical protein